MEAITSRLGRLEDLPSSLESRISRLVEDAGPLSPIIDYLMQTKGKRLRPLLTIWTAKACSKTFNTSPDARALCDVAAAIELVHMASLVHDDVIDEARERRGMPTVHLIWGLHSAILAGDYLFTRANKVALNYYAQGIPAILNQAIELVCEGEVAQDNRLFDPAVTREDYISHISKKTAALIGAACQAGAAMAQAPPQAQESLLRFGIELGCAFQIIDDIIDLTSDPAVSGKEWCNDLKRGVLTLPLIFGLESEAGSLIRQAFAKGFVSDEVAQEICSRLRATGCIDRARETAARFAAMAESRLDLLASSPEALVLLDIVHRACRRLA